MKFKPRGKYILVKPESDVVKTAGGIILAGESYNKLKQVVKAVVVDISKEFVGRIDIGDTVHYKKMYELSIEHDGERHVILKDEHIDVIENKKV